VTRFGEISSFGRIFFLELGAFFSEKVSPKWLGRNFFQQIAQN
jgi:hypothetical protein